MMEDVMGGRAERCGGGVVERLRGVVGVWWEGWKTSVQCQQPSNEWNMIIATSPSQPPHSTQSLRVSFRMARGE